MSSNPKSPILYITPELPFFPGGGGANIREFALLSRLAGSFHYTVIALRPTTAERVRALEKAGCTVQHASMENAPSLDRRLVGSIAGMPYRLLRFLWRRFLLMMPWLYPPVTRGVVRTFRRAVRRVDLADFDLVQVEHTYMLPIVREVKSRRPDLPVILTAHNVETLLGERLAQVHGSSLVRENERLAARQMAGMEDRLLREADAIAATSENDLLWIRSRVGGKTHLAVVPNGVDVDYFQERKADAEDQTLVFTGALDYPPNTEAVIWFREQVLPKLTTGFPRIRFHVAGSCRDRAKELSHPHDPVRERYDFNVPDIRPYIQRAAVYVVPLWAGSGTRLKILEAMACGRPVVSTRIGAEGLGAVHGETILIADSADEMVREIAGLLKSPDLRERMGEAARRWVREHYDWPLIATRQKELIERVLARGDRSSVQSNS